MRSFFCLLLTLFPFFSVISECVDFEPQDGSTHEGPPSSLVNKSVCAISGEYTDHVVDVVLPGPEPLVISRVYNSFAEGKPWKFNHDEKIDIYNSCYEQKPVYHACLITPSGTILNYIADKVDNFKKIKQSKFKFVPPKGLTNSAMMLSGKTNIKNQTFKYLGEESVIETISGEGSKKVFKEYPQKHFEGVFGLVSNKKPNGSIYLYQGKATGYDNLELSFAGTEKIICKNKNETVEFSHVEFSSTTYDEDEHLELHTTKTSDNRLFKYYFKRHKYHVTEKNYNKTESNNYPVTRHYLTSVKHPYAPFENYAYSEKGLSKDLHLTSKSQDGGKRYVKIDYYQRGVNCLGNNDNMLDIALGKVDQADIIDIEDKDDFRIDRVKRLRAPVGEDRTPIVTHSFDYHATIKKDKRNGQKKILEGYTDVYDAYRHKTRYSYDEEHRLTCLSQYTGQKTDLYQPYSEEHFTWGEKGSEEGLLLKKTFKDGSGNIIYERKFNYDDRGNVLSSTLCGNLSGLGSNEEETKTSTYSDDGLNLLLSETDCSGVTTTYKYKKGTDRLVKKFVSDATGIRVREFYFYDDNYALVKKVIDDGTQETYDDFTGVTERRYTYMTCRNKAPVGLPEVIEEKYWVPAKQEKILIKKNRMQIFG